jgi:ankyrin repeat protein
VLYCLTRRQLGRSLIASSTSSARIGVVGILKLDGVHELWNNSLVQLKLLQESWIVRFKNVPEMLWMAAFHGHLHLLKSMLSSEQSADMKLYMNRGNSLNMGKTPLIVAVERDHFEVVEFLLQNGADQDIPDFALNRPCHYARSGPVATLLEYSHKLNASGRTALEVSLINGACDVANVLLSMTSLSTDHIERLFFCSTRSRTFDSIRLLSEKFKNFPIDSIRNSIGNSLLMESVRHGSYEVFKFLTAHGDYLDFSIFNLENQTIMDISSTSPNVGISRYLEKQYKNLYCEK